jgi:succinoglycan biosynthesis protein ExoA
VFDWRADPSWPAVDVVMPIRNEAPHLVAAVAAIQAQDYPGELCILMAVGPSTDGTDAVARELAAHHASVTVVDNPSGRTPTALNLAISAGTSPVVVRVDGHSQLSDGYIEQAIETLRRTGAANVGGMQVPVATTPFETSVAAATTSWLGTGGPSYRTGGSECPVDTVYLGVFDRSQIEAIGLFDEHLIRNQDYELNIRLRAAGGTVVFDPGLSVGYVPRGTWRALKRQYFEYGWWKAEVLRIGVVAVVVAAAIGVRWRVAWVIPVTYGAALLSVGTGSARARTAGVVATIHGAWTWGLIRAVVGWCSGDRKSAEPAKPQQR